MGLVDQVLDRLQDLARRLIEALFGPEAQPEPEPVPIPVRDRR